MEGPIGLFFFFMFFFFKEVGGGVGNLPNSAFLLSKKAPLV